MRIVGSRMIKLIQFQASYELFVEGCKFNEQIHKLPSGGNTSIKKGLYRFKNHEQANRHWENCLAEKMTKQALNSE